MELNEHRDSARESRKTEQGTQKRRGSRFPEDKSLDQKGFRRFMELDRTFITFENRKIDQSRTHFKQMDLTSTGKQMRKRSGLDFNWRTNTNMKTTKYQYEDYQLAYVGNFQILTFDYLGKTFHRF